MSRLPFIACILLTATAVRAGTSADYSLAPEAIDGGGLRGTSTHYTLSDSMMAGEAGSSASYTVHTGFAGQTDTVLVTTTVSVCDSYTWVVNGQTYTQSGTYRAVNGFDVQELVLTITASTTRETVVVACAPYVWAVNGVSYSATDTYLYLPPNSCTTEILKLTIIDAETCRTPVFPPYNLTTSKGQALVIPGGRITTRASVPNGDAVTLTGLVDTAGAVTTPVTTTTTLTTAVGATVVLASGNITYTPLPNVVGADSFKVLLTSTSGGTLVAVVSVTVSGTVTPPVNNTTEQNVEIADGVVTRVQLTFRGIPRVTYLVQRSDANAENWVTRLTVAADANGKINFVDVPQTGETSLPPAAYYRTRLP